MPTSEEITKAAEENDNMDVIATPLKIAKKTLPLRPTTQSDYENHDAETELVKTPANDTPLPRSPKSLISISSSSGSDNEQAKETLLNDDDGAAAIMKGPKYDATHVHERYALNTISNRTELIVTVWPTPITLQLACRWDLAISRGKRLPPLLAGIRHTMDAISQLSSQEWPAI